MSYAFSQNEDNEFVLTVSDGTTTTDLFVVTDSERVDLVVNDTLRFGAATDTIIIPEQGGLLFSGVNRLRVATEGGSLQTFTSTDTDQNGPGTLFVSRPEAFYSQNDGLTAVIEQVRQIEVIRPLTVETVVRTDGMGEFSVLQVNGDDVVTLSGAQVIDVTAQDSGTYGSNTVTVRRSGSVISRTTGIGTLGAITTQGGQAVFDSYTGNGPPFTGPGQLFTDRTGRAFFSNDAATLSTINEAVVLDTFNYNNQTGALQNRAGDTVLDLSNRQSQSLSTARSVEFESAQRTLTFRDGGDRIVSQSFGVSQFSLYDNNELLTFTTDESRSLSGGGTLYTDSGGNALFSTNPALDQFVSTSAPVPPVPSATFTFSTNSQGIGSLNGNGQNLVTLSGAQTFDVPRFGSVTFQNNDVLVADSAGDVVATFPDIDQFSVNTDTQPLGVFNDSAPSSYPGPGRLYVNNGQAFYTTCPDLRNDITSFLNRIGPPPIGFDTDLNETTPTGNVNLTVGGQPVVELTGSSITTSQPEQVALYNDNTISLLDSVTVGPGTLFYDDEVLSFVSDDSTTTSFGNFTLLYYTDGRSPPEFESGSLPNDTTLSGPGRLFFSTTGPQTGALFVTSDDVADDTYLFLLADLFAAEEVASNVTELGFFDGNSFLEFTGSTPTLLPGDGIFYTNGDQSFYSTDDPTNTLIFSTIVDLIPTTADFVNGIIEVSNNGREIYSFTPGGTTITTTFGSNDVLSFTDDVLSSNRFVDTPGINSLTVFDGIEATTFPANSNVTFTGPGTLVVDTNAGTAFFTPIPQAGRAILDAVELALSTFISPVIDMPLTSRVVSKYPEVDANFGQFVRAYEGADVRLFCDVIAGNPDPEVEFFIEVGGVDVPINISSDKFEIVDSLTLVIRDVALDDSADYTCVASNQAGMASRETSLSIRRARK